jgi:hypothetical protein
MKFVSPIGRVKPSFPPPPSKREQSLGAKSEQVHQFASLTLDGRVLRVYLWFHSVSGFVLTTLWIGGLIGVKNT